MNKKGKKILITFKPSQDKEDGGFYGQECQDPEITMEFRKLHTDLINKILKFCKKHKLDIDEIFLTADGLSYSIKYGKWQPGTDSSFEMYKTDKKDLESPFLWSI